MKKIAAVLTAGLILGTMGCATLGKPLKVPDDGTDKPEVKPKRLPPAKTNIDADEINDANFKEKASEMEKEMKEDRRFLPAAK